MLPGPVTGAPSASLKRFHPLVAEWFRESVGMPTDVQEQSWARIAAGEHLLVTAPTGSGKTLAAFLWAINEFASGVASLGDTRILYVSPLKALNHDVQRNLRGPLNALRERFERAGEPFAMPRVGTRSGDTPSSERQRLLRRPPEILITTPESLNLMLSTASGQRALTGVRTVILDEIHAVVGSKRGTHLITAVERLAGLAGEVQRIALSATVRPLETVSAFLGGYRRNGDGWTARPVQVISSCLTKRYALRVERPEPPPEPTDSPWRPIAEACRAIILANRTTLVFTNSRRLCERLTGMINEGRDVPLAYSHHGSLSREIRLDVERRLKDGGLRAIIATHSLELGIDIGDLDEVLLVQSPPSVASAIQRIGRAGHQVGETSRARLFPTHGRDLLHAAVLAQAIPAQDIEPVRPVRNALDVLAQVLLSMVVVSPWTADALYDALRGAWPYHELPRAMFDGVVAMLAGRYQEARIRELKARVVLDPGSNTITALPNARLALYLGGGTIPDRGTYHLRHAEFMTRIGELDEEFVWEAAPGQAFVLGAQAWQIQRITHNDVFVVPAGTGATPAPFWRGEEFSRDPVFSLRIGTFLEVLEARLGAGTEPDSVFEELGLDSATADALRSYLLRQRAATRGPLPHRHHLLVEHVAAGPQGAPGNQVILHALWGARVTRPYALALDAAWEQRFGDRPRVFAEDDMVVLQLPHDASAHELLSLVSADRLESLLRVRLEGSGTFGAQFRQCAGRALLVTRERIHQRLPLWVNRLRTQKLFQAVSRYPEFPVLIEAWRSCLRDEFDMDTLRRLLDELERGEMRWSEIRTPVASPFGESSAWRQVNQYMYLSDELGSDAGARTGEDAIRQVVEDDGLRPDLSPALIREFETKRQRVHPGYSPGSAAELQSWLQERLFLPGDEWDALLDAMIRDHGAAAKTWRPVNWPAGLGEPDPGQLDGRRLTQWLSYYGPRPVSWVVSTLGVESGELAAAIDEGVDAGVLIRGRMTEGTAQEEICDAENLGALLRMRRRRARPRWDPWPSAAYPAFLAAYQGLGREPSLESVLIQLSGYFAPAAQWEREILPARRSDYRGSELDECLSDAGWMWRGENGARVALFPREDVDLMAAAPRPASGPAWFRDPEAKYDFEALIRASGLGLAELTARLWAAVWAGEVTCDRFAVLRQGIDTGFKPPGIDAGSMRGRPRFGGRAFLRWQRQVPAAGSWFRVPTPEAPTDAVDRDERMRQRARIVVDRYGVIFPTLLRREHDGFRWTDVFPALRVLELAGEVVGGHYFQGLPGPQFASPDALARLQAGLPETAPFWVNASDPASACGLGVRGHPARQAATHLVYRGSTLVVVSKRNGREMTVAAEPGDPEEDRWFDVLEHLLTRYFQPLRRVVVECINDAPAADSPFLPALQKRFDVVTEHRHLVVHAPLTS